MNIFWLDKNFEKSSKYHVDKHVVKMPLESAQMIFTTLTIDRCFGHIPRKLTSEELKTLKAFESPFPYRPAMPNHPLNVWARSMFGNFMDLVEYHHSISFEYTYRYNKIHKSFTKVEEFEDVLSISAPFGVTDAPLCMPDEYKSDDLITSYRSYYMGDKAYIAAWKNREVPDWWQSKNEQKKS